MSLVMEAVIRSPWFDEQLLAEAETAAPLADQFGDVTLGVVLEMQPAFPALPMIL